MVVTNKLDASLNRLFDKKGWDRGGVFFCVFLVFLFCSLFLKGIMDF
jgi:hypothetical protein